MTEPPGVDRLRVRPYALTGGRVRSSTELPLETIVRLTTRGQAGVDSQTLERREICALCVAPTSIAELSAHLGVPLGVVRVLVGDMVTEGLLDSHRTLVDGEERPDLRLLERVLDGLQAL
ncbi:MAG: DUF742 domain-containing protein [Acidimicrobiales bacterium]